MASFYQIGEVCALTGLTPRTLHYYDEISLLVPSERLAGGQRLYTAGDLERIERIKELKRLLGLSLAEIKQILDAEAARTRYLADAEKAPDPRARRGALERALAVTEAQWRSVQDKVEQLTRFGRRLDRQVRDLRRLLKTAGAAAAPAPQAGLAGGMRQPAPQAGLAGGMRQPAGARKHADAAEVLEGEQ